MLAPDFWKRVNALIKSNNTTQQSLSLDCGFSKRRIETLIAGDTFPRLDEGVRIARALHTSVEYLVTGEEAAPCAMDKDKLIKAIAKAVNDAVP